VAPSDDSGVHPRPINPRPTVVPRTSSGTANAEPVTVRPRTFGGVQEVADKFKDGQSVIMNLEGTDKETTRRLLDFASGLCYGLNGTMEKVASGVFLLKPAARAGGYDDTGFGD
jgi:cell division inhibitor SepF